MQQVLLCRAAFAATLHGGIGDEKQQQLRPKRKLQSGTVAHPPARSCGLRKDVLQQRNLTSKTCLATEVRASQGAGYYSAVEDPAEANMRIQVAKRLEQTASRFKTFGSLGFWVQLLCTSVSAGVLAFSVAVTGTATSPVTKYLSVAGIAAGFLSVFWSFSYMRLSGRLEGAVGDPAKAPQRTEVVDKLKTGLAINVLGMLSTVLGLQATIGLLVAKALNSPAATFFQGPYVGHTPVLALDVFLLQACGNALLSHFLGLVFNLELLRSVTNKPPPQKVILRPA